LVPRGAILDAGRHYLARMLRSRGVPESDVVHAAVRSLGLEEVAPFDPKEKVIEYVLAPSRPLVSLSVQGFVDETSRDSAAPGGGSVAALSGAVAAALAAMVANLPHPKSAYREVRDELEAIAVRAQEIKRRLLDAMDEDTWAFQGLMAAGSAPDDERDAAVRRATLGAARVPLEVLDACPEIVDLCRRAGELGLPASASDAGVGAAMARAAAVGAFLNVAINLRELADDPEAAEMLARARDALSRTSELANGVESQVMAELGIGPDDEVKQS
jgi:glutamate formiminotransferase/formiminotetrahydrofolate cyclodeaminase